MNVNIRKLEKEDLEQRVSLFNEKYVYDYMNLNVPLSLSETINWFDNNLFNEKRVDFTFLIDNEICGFGGLTGLDIRSRNIELYILIDKKFQGNGLGVMLTKWLCNYGFMEFSLHKIYLHVLSINKKAKRVYEKIGFQTEGKLIRHQYHHGEHFDKYIMGLLQKEWTRLDWSNKKNLKFSFSL